MDLMQAFNNKYLKAEPPVAEVGDTVRVHVHIKEKRKLNLLFFTYYTLRHRDASSGIAEEILTKKAVERQLPLHSPISKTQMRSLTLALLPTRSRR